MTFIGSNFENDLSDEYLNKIIHDLIICVEQGNICILLYLDQIYQTFYDLFNQNFI